MTGSVREHVIVAGGAGGIGAEIVRRMHARGRAVTVMDILDPVEQAAEQAANQAGRAGGDSRGTLQRLRVDVTDQDSVERGFTLATDRLGPANRLVVSAGAHGQLAEVVNLDVTAWQELMDVHVKGTLLLAQAFGRRLLARMSGADGPPDGHPDGPPDGHPDGPPDAALVAIGSTTGITASRRQGDYGPAKAALAQLTRVLAVEWAASGIRANTVAAGQTQTPFVEKMIANGYDVTPTRRRTPLGRLARPDEVAAAVEFLLLDATFVTGAVLPVDGGWTALGR